MTHGVLFPNENEIFFNVLQSLMMFNAALHVQGTYNEGKWHNQGQGHTWGKVYILCMKQTLLSAYCFSHIFIYNIFITPLYRLAIQVKVSCDADYYGANCDVYCKAGAVCWGHYTCDSLGQKVCKAGWTGDGCDTQIPGGAADCSVFDGR